MKIIKTIEIVLGFYLLQLKIKLKKRKESTFIYEILFFSLRCTSSYESATSILFYSYYLYYVYVRFKKKDKTSYRSRSHIKNNSFIF